MKTAMLTLIPLCLICFFALSVTTATGHGVYRGVGDAHYVNGSRRAVHTELTNLKLAHFAHRGSLHLDRIELRSEENGRNGFYVHNPTDPRYPLWVAARASVNSLWPKAKEESRKRARLYEFSNRFNIRFVSARDDVMLEAARRCGEHLFQSVAAVSDWSVTRTLGSISEMKVAVRNNNFVKYPHLGMREDYELTIDGSGVTLIAQENWGVLRGLETLEQLVFVTRDQPTRFLIQENFIRDKPAYPHRGLMIDTARHFVKKSTLLENLEAMAMNKMNVFHWHMVDDQSFPYLGQKFPQLADRSAFPGGLYFYTVEDIREIVEFARLRGIRVIPEFDTPDHTHSWGHGMPSIMSWCKVDGLYYMGPLNPISEETFTFLKEFFSEIADLFPDSHMHLGMDEVSTDCWRLNGTFDMFMRRQGMQSFDQLVAYYANRLVDIIGKFPKKKQLIVWEDILGKDSASVPLHLPQDTIVHVWITRDAAKVAEWAKKYRVIHSEDWYLDHQAYGADWVKRYTYSPGNALGGEACMWTEYQSDGTVTPHTWPSVSAVAERLWTGPGSGDAVEAAPRIEEQNCRMQARGIRSGVAGGPSMCQGPVGRFRPPWQSGCGNTGEPVNQVVTVHADMFRWFHWALIALLLGCLVHQRFRAAKDGTGQVLQQQRSTKFWCRFSPRLWFRELTVTGCERPGTLLYAFLLCYVICWLAVVGLIN